MKYLTLLPLLLFSGCACHPEIVYVPVASCVEPPEFSVPALKTDSLPSDYTTRQAVEALANDHRQLKGSLEQCIILLDGYR